ncbi:MAG: AAA family ATPase [Sporichthyaceae bacterium]|nr:AAA family ATPase [Sporichthyaceae bacterium]
MTRTHDKHALPLRLDLDGLIDDPQTRIVVCCGAGGVGKTTTAAALALRAAERGRRTVVLTIDPAKRLAQSLGLEHLDNVPRAVAGVHLARDGSLDAMMLDMKRTFDEIVLTHAEPRRAKQILANPFYLSLSSSFAGTQEYMAMEKLGQLHATGQWDLIVVDTPPSRSALDFLDAPSRLGSFLDGRLIRTFLVPAKAGGRFYRKIVTTGLGLATGALSRLLGGRLLQDVQTFVAALDTMFGGFRERAEQTYRLLQAPGTAFLVLATPEPDALREAAYFVNRLAAEKMPLAGLLLNQMHVAGGGQLSAQRALAAAEALDGQPDHTLTAGLLRLYADRLAVAARDHRMSERFISAHPAVPVAQAPAQPVDVADLPGLRQFGASLGSASHRS